LHDVEDAMRPSVRIPVCVAVCVAVVACGKPSGEKRVEDVKKGADAVQTSADQMAKGLDPKMLHDAMASIDLKFASLK
jgi:hypothetical protein